MRRTNSPQRAPSLPPDLPPQRRHRQHRKIKSSARKVSKRAVGAPEKKKKTNKERAISDRSTWRHTFLHTQLEYPIPCQIDMCPLARSPSGQAVTETVSVAEKAWANRTRASSVASWTRHRRRVITTPALRWGAGTAQTAQRIPTGAIAETADTSLMRENLGRPGVTLAHHAQLRPPTCPRALLVYPQRLHTPLWVLRAILYESSRAAVRRHHRQRADHLGHQVSKRHQRQIMVTT